MLHPRSCCGAVVFRAFVHARFARSCCRAFVLSCFRAFVRAPRAENRKEEFVLNLEFVWDFEFEILNFRFQPVFRLESVGP